MSKVGAFTLAETLITLMVIGIVAAITIPSLMASYQDRSVKTATKKAQSVLSNAYKKMMAEENVGIEDLPIIKCAQNFSCLSENHKKYFLIGSEQSKSKNQLPSKYLAHDTVDEQGNVTSANTTNESSFSWSNVPYIFKTTDGITYGFVSENDADTIDVVVDVNGNKSPNKVGKDMLLFRINNQGTIADVSAELDNSGCSVNDVSKCTTDADFQTLWNSSNDTGDVLRYIKINDEKCMLIGHWYSSEPYRPYPAPHDAISSESKDFNGSNWDIFIITPSSIAYNSRSCK